MPENKNCIKQETMFVCKICIDKPCKFGLNTEAIMGCIRVLNTSTAVPFECPLLIKEEFWIRNLLLDLDPWDLNQQRIAALESEWNNGNYGEVYYSSGNLVIETIEYILQKWRQKKCSVIGLIPGQKCPEFLKPAALPQWFIDNWIKSTREDKNFTEALTNEITTQHPPLKISRISWQHKDDILRKVSPDIAYDGNIINLIVEFENCIDNTGVDFFVYGNIKEGQKQLTEIHTRCLNMKGTVEWTVDLSKCDTEIPNLQFDCKTQRIRSQKCSIDIAVTVFGGALLHIRDRKSNLLSNVFVILKSNDKEIFSDTLMDGILEITDIKESDLKILCMADGNKVSFPVELIPGKGPYTAQIITLELENQSQEQK